MTVDRKYCVLASVLVVVTLLLPSCTPAAAPTPKPAAPPPAAAPSEPKPGAPTPTPKPAADQPRYGGTLNIVNPGDPGHLDPQRLRGILLHAVVAPGYSGILQWDFKDPEKLAPDLAEKWEVSPDGKVYTFYLRKDVQWHDGKPFTAADAKFNLERLNEKISPFVIMFLAVDKAEALDPSVFRVSLKYPSASLPVQLATGWISILPKHVIEAKGDMRKDLVGTGPFKFKSYMPHVSVELLKNENYFVKGQPYLDRVTFYLIRDRSTQLAAFRTGQARLTSAATPLNKPEADLIRKQVPTALILPINRLKGQVLFMNANVPPWNDVRVRRAAFLAWDRQAAMKVLGEGAGEIRASMLAGEYALPKEEVMKLPGFRQPKDADRAEAKKLMAEAGHPSGFPTRILTRADYPDYVKLAEFAADQLKVLGIAGTVDSQESVVYLEKKQRVEYHSMAILPVLDNADPDGAARYFASPNESGFVDPEIDKLFAQQSQAIDPAERKKLVRQMEMRLVDQAWYVTSHWDENYLFAWPDLRNAEPKYLGANNNIRVVKDIWLAK